MRNVYDEVGGAFCGCGVEVNLKGASVRTIAGFTLVELIAVMVIVGVIAAVAIPRFVGRDAFDSRGFTDQVSSALRFARQQAVAQRRTVCVTITANQLTMNRSSTFGGACDRDLANPGNGQPAYAINAPNGVLMAGQAFPFNFTFDPSGRPSTGFVLNVNADVNRSITVEAVTGYVH